MINIISVLLLLNYVNGHTWMLNPQPRLGDLVMPAKGGSACGKNNPVSTVATYKRGDVIQVSWGRNNHNSGYIRLYVVPLLSSDDMSKYNAGSLAQVGCYMSDCVGANNDPFAGDPSGTVFNGLLCNLNFQIPLYLSDGDYTLRWLWSSGGDSFGIKNLGLIDFASCHDFSVFGGVGPSAKPLCPLFVGGDSANPSLNTCEYFKDNVINTCTDDRNCFSWHYKSPPDEIIKCPSNIITLDQSKKKDFRGSSLKLHIGISDIKISNPDPSKTARVPELSDKSPTVTQTVQVNPKTSTLRSCVCDSDIDYYCSALNSGSIKMITKTNS